MSTIQKHYIDHGSISGSNGLRDALGSFYRIRPSDAEGDVNSSFKTLSDGTSIITDSGVPLRAGRIVDGHLIYSVKSDNRSITTSSSEVLVPTVKLPVRLVGNSDNIESDEDWHEQIRDSISLALYRDTNFVLNVPYELLNIKAIDFDNYESYEAIDISYAYNYSLMEFQEHTYTIADKLIPNYYSLLASAYGSDENEIIKNYATLEGTQEPDYLFTPVKTVYPPTYDITTDDLTPSKKYFLDKLRNMQLYLSSSFIDAQFSSSTAPFVENALSNIYFNEDNQGTLFPLAAAKKDVIPYYVKIQIPVESMLQGDAVFKNMISDSGYENLFINQVHNHFTNQTVRATATRSQSFKVLKTAIQNRDGSAVESTLSSSVFLAAVDYYSLVTNSLVNAQLPNQNNFYIPNGQDITEKIANANGLHCYSHSIPSLKLIDLTNNYLQSNFNLALSDSLQLEDILDAAASPNHSEILLFKIEKIVNGTRPATQNFYFMRSGEITAGADGNDLVFYDSQVRYGESVTYNVYAYVLVSGFTYRVTDVLTTKLIASQTDAAGRDINCLEFFDLNTQEPAAQLYTLTTNVEDNRLFTNAQISTYARYLADLCIVCEPSIKVYETLIARKSVTVLDHPTNKMDAYPFQRMNDSQIIGFLSNTTSFAPDTYPTTLASLDRKIKNVYLESNNLLETEKINNFSKSKPDRVEIYRKSIKPRFRSDFNEEDLVTVKFLDIEESKFKLSNCLHEEKILVNTKYYYVLRFVSENNTIGDVTNVIEAELVNDGGYIYSIFTEHSDDDLAKMPENNQTKAFKKLIHLVPNIGQIEFVDDNVDYSKPAETQKSNIQVGSSQDSLFGKTFKIRLTSKKTGKKLDLNVTYNLTD